MPTARFVEAAPSASFYETGALNRLAFDSLTTVFQPELFETGETFDHMAVF